MKPGFYPGFHQRPRSPWIAVLAALALATPAQAQGLEQARQGALVVGQVEAGTSVLLDGKPVRTTRDGRFIAGFGRDAAPEASLTIRRPDGQEKTRNLTVLKSDWPIQRINGLPPSKVTPDPRTLARIKEENALLAHRRERDTPEPWFTRGLVQPTDGLISGVFGAQRILNGEPRSPHSGTDFAASAGAPVKAAGDGIVTLAHSGMVLTGLTVLLDHGHGLSTVYAHLQDMNVSEGQAVRQGQTIGHVGATGRATGPHLHFGVSWFEVKLDPEQALRALPAAFVP